MHIGGNLSIQCRPIDEYIVKREMVWEGIFDAHHANMVEESSYHDCLYFHTCLPLPSPPLNKKLQVDFT